MNDWQKMVREFHYKFAQPVGVGSPRLLPQDRYDLRETWVAEESEEMYLAQDEGDLPGVADGIVDQLYFLIGTAVEMGIDLDPLFRAVHAANLRKYRVPGDEKIRKPVSWVAPDIAGELTKQGWKP